MSVSSTSATEPGFEYDPMKSETQGLGLALSPLIVIPEELNRPLPDHIVRDPAYWTELTMYMKNEDGIIERELCSEDADRTWCNDHIECQLPRKVPICIIDRYMPLLQNVCDNWNRRLLDRELHLDKFWFNMSAIRLLALHLVRWEEANRLALDQPPLPYQTLRTLHNEAMNRFLELDVPRALRSRRSITYEDYRLAVSVIHRPQTRTRRLAFYPLEEIVDYHTALDWYRTFSALKYTESGHNLEASVRYTFSNIPNIEADDLTSLWDFFSDNEYYKTLILWKIDKTVFDPAADSRRLAEIYEWLVEEMPGDLQWHVGKYDNVDDSRVPSHMRLWREKLRGVTFHELEGSAG